MCMIYGETDAAIAETATFFWSLKVEDDPNALLRIHDYIGLQNEFYDECEHACKFDFATFQPEQLAQILDANPTRAFELRTGKWTAEQSAVLASRPYPLNLTLGKWLSFEDGGNQFVEVLKERETSFGSLGVDYSGDGPLCGPNLESLVKLDVIEALRTSNLHEERFHLPFSANVKALHCTVEVAEVMPNEFEALEIVASDLRLQLMLEESDSCNELVIAFFHRVAELGHLERLTLSIGELPCFIGEYFSGNIKPVVKALLRVIHANPKLSYLDISDCVDAKWATHFMPIFKSMKNHEGLRTLVVGSLGSTKNFTGLKKLLSHNRKLEVIDPSGRRLSNGPAIDNLYALNRVYNGSTSLLKGPSFVRSLLVSSALVNTTSDNFQQTALLLANHTDVLWEWISDVHVGVAGLEMMENEASFDALQQQSHNASKRKLTVETSPVAKKAARAET